MDVLVVILTNVRKASTSLYPYTEAGGGLPSESESSDSESDSEYPDTGSESEFLEPEFGMEPGLEWTE